MFARLAEHGLLVWERPQWTDEQRQFLQTYFAREIQPILTPLAVEELKPGPLLPNLQLHVAAIAPLSLWEKGRGRGQRREKTGKSQPRPHPNPLPKGERGPDRSLRNGWWSCPCPASCRGWVPLPAEKDVHLARVDDVIAANLGGHVSRLRGGGHGRLPHHPRRRRRAAGRRGDRRPAARDGGGGAVAAPARRRAADDFGPARSAAAEMAGRLAEARRRGGLRGRRPAGGRGPDGDCQPAGLRRSEDRRLAAAGAARPDRGRRPLGGRFRTTTCCCSIPTRASTRW